MKFIYSFFLLFFMLKTNLLQIVNAVNNNGENFIQGCFLFLLIFSFIFNYFIHFLFFVLFYLFLYYLFYKYIFYLFNHLFKKSSEITTVRFSKIHLNSIKCLFTEDWPNRATSAMCVYNNNK